MTDFKLALKAGFAAAEEAENAKREIEEVLARLKKEVLESSEGKILIELTRFERPSPAATFAGSSSGVDIKTLFKPRPTYLALAGSNPLAKTEPREIAEWEQSRTGYPCIITWSFEERQCTDRVSLETCLSDLLQDPLVGEKLYALAQLKAK